MKIDTKRLAIKKLTLNDRVPFFKYRSLPEVCEYQSFHPKDDHDVVQFIEGNASEVNINNTWFQVGLFLKSNHQLIGDIGLHFLEDGYQVEIGYTLNPEYQGVGYATEGLTSVINYLFNDLKKHRITASVDPNNAKSIRLLERLNFRKEAHFIQSLIDHGKWVDDCIYAILNEEWENK